MTEKQVLQFHDFCEIEYTGKLPDEVIFDTTSEEAAHQAGLPHHHGSLRPVIVCIGERQLLPGLDKDLEGKEIGKEYTIVLPPELAFGKRDIKNMRMIPMNTFKEHDVQPRPGLQVDVDGERGIVTSIAGGRVIVNFNHPLAGKEVTYTYTIKRKITDVKEKVLSYISGMVELPADKLEVSIQDEKVVVTLPVTLPQQLTDLLAKKLSEIKAAEKVEFVLKESVKKEPPLTSPNGQN